MIENNLDFVSIFEQKLCQYTGFKNAICVDCCTNGILISLELLNILGIIQKSISPIYFSQYTYLSVPMTLINNNWKIRLIDDKWIKSYEIKNTNVFDAATDFHRDMNDDYNIDAIVCISFQQKKRLSLGRGGAILFNNNSYIDILKRLRYDGRNPYIQDRIEIKMMSDYIINGYHCYMEPEKAAKGIALINQEQYLNEYKQHSWQEYEDLSNLKCLQKL